MSAKVIDIRLVQERDGRWRPTIEGNRSHVAHNDPRTALLAAYHTLYETWRKATPEERPNPRECEPYVMDVHTAAPTNEEGILFSEPGKSWAMRGVR